MNRILHPAPPLDTVLGEKTAADGEVQAHTFTHSLVDLAWETGTVLPGAAITIFPAIECRQKRGHGVGVGIVELHPVEARGLRTQGGLGEKAREDSWEVTDVGQMGVGHPLPVALPEGLELTRSEDLFELFVGQTEKVLADLLVREITTQRRPVTIGDLEIAAEEFLRLKNFSGSGRRRMVRKSMSWIKRRV
jgi:hypothetical protein